MSRILSLIATLVVLAGCTSREPAVHDSKRAPDPNKPTSDLAPAGSREGSAPVSAGPATTKLVLSERHVDERYGFELAYPSGWEVRSGDGMLVLMVNSLRERPDDVTIENINVVIEPLASTMSVEAYANDSEPMLRSALVEYELLSRGSAELAGLPAARLEYQHTFEGRPLWALSYAVVIDQQAYVVTATAEREAERWRAELEAMVLSFRFKRPA